MAVRKKIRIAVMAAMAPVFGATVGLAGADVFLGGIALMAAEALTFILTSEPDEKVFDDDYLARQGW